MREDENLATLKRIESKLDSVALQVRRAEILGLGVATVLATLAALPINKLVALVLFVLGFLLVALTKFLSRRP